MAPAARVLAEAAAQAVGESAAEAAPSGSGLCLRVVVNPASLAGDVATVQAAVQESLGTDVTATYGSPGYL